MPTYQYACTECDHAFEQFQSFSDDALSACPRCEGRLRKVYNAVGVVFKGSGFYRNDSRADAKVNGSGTTTESGGSTKTADSGSSDSGSSEKKTDTKPEKKAETTSVKKSDTSSSAA